MEKCEFDLGQMQKNLSVNLDQMKKNLKEITN